MDSPASPERQADAVLAEVVCTWNDRARPGARAKAVVLHLAPGLLVLETSDRRQPLPPPGTPLQVTSATGSLTGRLAEYSRGGRFLVSLGDRPVRGALRLRVSLPGSLRSPELDGQIAVEIVDLTTGGARVRGVELPVGSSVTLEFIPPGRDEPVSVRAVVAHASHRSDQAWIGVVFRLVAFRGGR
ncbi:MAG TPA: PilZ domain-containing protein [Chloroflexota bacterium]